jgi:hypothetical protein
MGRGNDYSVEQMPEKEFWEWYNSPDRERGKPFHEMTTEEFEASELEWKDRSVMAGQLK